MTKHGPILPLWLCETCGRPWPCAARRLELLSDYAASPISLALHMGACLTSAKTDMSWAPPDALQRRFLGWMP
ncbi:hypothetical protein EV382_3921 [Micromonospora violae]|uniref:Flavin reductase n=1 Tax=Micromonospora violae TaxID=1278207 RepID=A0A4Q7ULX7_9ACTN|nr:hypothetical protein [Micromonospora violae]RZT80663.1 hypothetical protein EV382_3921 [Micromonospora violae]